MECADRIPADGRNPARLAPITEVTMNIKRSIALILVLATCALLVLTSCDKLKQADVEADPAAAVKTAATASADAACARISLRPVSAW